MSEPQKPSPRRAQAQERMRVYGDSRRIPLKALDDFVARLEAA